MKKFSDITFSPRCSRLPAHSIYSWISFVFCCCLVLLHAVLGVKIYVQVNSAGIGQPALCQRSPQNTHKIFTRSCKRAICYHTKEYLLPRQRIFVTMLKKYLLPCQGVFVTTPKSICYRVKKVFVTTPKSICYHIKKVYRAKKATLEQCEMEKLGVTGSQRNH